MTERQFLATPLFENDGPPLEKLAPMGGSEVHAVTNVGVRDHIVVMGVAGCGKSAVGQRIATLLALPLIEGDDFHPASNVQKMQQGMALDDADRLGWLQTLSAELARRPQGAVLTCSALKANYRNALRAGTPALGFVHLAITQAESLKRVAQRADHFYPPSLVASQFEALQDPAGEPNVLVLDGSAALGVLATQVAAWVHSGKSRSFNSTIRN
jgi:gluconokinase